LNSSERNGRKLHHWRIDKMDGKLDCLPGWTNGSNVKITASKSTVTKNARLCRMIYCQYKEVNDGQLLYKNAPVSHVETAPGYGDDGCAPKNFVGSSSSVTCFFF